MKKHLLLETRKTATGFTLAEVLVTLVIVGVIAGLTIPSLVQNIQDAQYKTAYKKAFADISQAFSRAKNDSAFIDINNNSTNVITNIRTLENYFSVTKTCTDAVAQGCWIDNCSIGESDCFWTGNTNNDQARSEGFVDNSGREWAHYKSNAGWFIMMVDTNGAKGPNRLGRDRFPFFFDDSNSAENAGVPIKVRPYTTNWVSSDPTHCSFGNCYYLLWLEQ